MIGEAKKLRKALEVIKEGFLRVSWLALESEGGFSDQHR